jgi:hypothetical protein
MNSIRKKRKILSLSLSTSIFSRKILRKVCKFEGEASGFLGDSLGVREVYMLINIMYYWKAKGEERFDYSS